MNQSKRLFVLAMASAILFTTTPATASYRDYLADYLRGAAAEEAAEYDGRGAAQFTALADLVQRTGEVRLADLPEPWQYEIRYTQKWARYYRQLLRLETSLNGLTAGDRQRHARQVAQTWVDCMHARHEMSEPAMYIDSTHRYLELADEAMAWLAPYDRDGDGIADGHDGAPDAAENFNGYQDEDGIPDELPDRMVIIGPGEHFDDSSRGAGTASRQGAAGADADGRGGYLVDERAAGDDGGFIRNLDMLVRDGDEFTTADASGQQSLGGRRAGASELDLVYFAFDSAELTAVGRDRLDQAARILKANAGIRVRIEGHCDHTGTEEYNQALSERRAESVKWYLVSRHRIDSERLTTRGYGETRPVASNRLPAGRAMNRRVEWTVTRR